MLTGKVRIRESTRQRAVAAARPLDYRANRIASALASGRYAAVAMLIPDITNLVNANLVKAVEEVCGPRNHTVTICHTDKDVGRERAHLDDLLGYRPAGLIAKAEGAEPACYERLVDAGTRIVLVDNPIAGLALPIVRFDREVGIRQAFACLARAGHRRVGAIVPPSTRSAASLASAWALPDRLEVRALVDRCAADYELDVVIEQRPLRSLSDGRDATAALLAASRPPTALYAATWLHTLGMLAVVNRLEPEQRVRLGLIGTGATEYLEAVAPWLSAVDVPSREQERIAAERLFTEIDGAAAPSGREVVLPLRLIERGSTAFGPAAAAR